MEPESPHEFLDFVVVLLLAITITLLILWAASTLNRDSAFAELPTWLRDAVSSVWGKIGALGAVILSAWKLLLRRARPLGWYAGWVAGGVVAMLVLIIGTSSVVNHGSANELFELDFRVPLPGGAPPMLSFIAQEPVKKGPRFIVYQPQEGSYTEAVEIPRAAGRFYAEFRRAQEGAEYFKVFPAPTMICLERTAARINIIRDARLDCTEGKACTIRRDDPGLVKACAIGTSRLPFVPYMAEAAGEPQAPQPAGWAVPSLVTLRRLSAREAIAYTEFTLTMAALAQLRNATSLSYAIRVNGTPVYIDGWQPEMLREPFYADKGLSLSFGLENLDFAGSKGGYENIEVSLIFRKDNTILQESRVELRYVALRPFEPQQVRASDGLPITWRANYYSAGERSRYTVFLSEAPLTSAAPAETMKAKIDAAELKVRGLRNGLAARELPLVGVVRPPLPPNPSFGVMAGWRLPSGQIQFTFNQNEAAVMCRELLDFRRLPVGQAVIPKFVYRYELERPKREDRGTPCSEVVAASPR